MKYFQTKRNLPVNFEIDDKDLFLHELYLNIKKPKIIKRYNIYTFNGQLKKFKYFNIYYKHWKLREPRALFKIKSIFKEFSQLVIFKRFHYTFENIDKAIWITNEKSNRYFHWMLDVGQRIQIVTEYLERNELTGYKFLIPQRYFENDYVKSVINLYKIDFMLIDDKKLYKIRKLVIPYHLAQSGNYNPEVVKAIRSKFYNSNFKVDNLISDKKIWITRQNSRLRKIKNFDEIEKILTKFGFEIVDFDTMNFSEQVINVMQADTIGGIHGGGLANMLFLKKDKKVIEIRGINDKFNNCYFSLASALNLKYYYFLASVKDNDFYHNDYEVDVEKFLYFLSRNFN